MKPEETEIKSRRFKNILLSRIHEYAYCQYKKAT